MDKTQLYAIYMKNILSINGYAEFKSTEKHVKTLKNKNVDVVTLK